MAYALSANLLISVTVTYISPLLSFAQFFPRSETLIALHPTTSHSTSWHETLPQPVSPTTEGQINLPKASSTHISHCSITTNGLSHLFRQQ